MMTLVIVSNHDHVREEPVVLEILCILPIPAPSYAQVTDI